MKLTFGGQLERPNLCFLCETTPPIGTKVVDTERYFDGFPHTLRGRRYVCEKCVNSMVKFFDLADARTVEVARSEELRAQLLLRGLKLRLDKLVDDLQKVAEAPEVLIGEASGSIREASSAGVGAPEVRDSEADDKADEQAGSGADSASEDRTAGSEDGESAVRHRAPNRAAKRTTAGAK